MSPVTPDELSQSELFIVKQVQRECFPKEVSALMEGRELHRTSSIISQYSIQVESCEFAVD